MSVSGLGLATGIAVVTCVETSDRTGIYLNRMYRQHATAKLLAIKD